VRAQAFSLILLYVNISSAAPHSKVRHIRLCASPQLIRSTTLDSICRASVPHMDQGSKTFTPEGLRQPGLVQHGGETLRCWLLMTKHVIEVIEVCHWIMSHKSLKYVIEVPTRTISNTIAIYTCLPKTRPIVTEFTSCCSWYNWLWTQGVIDCFKQVMSPAL